ncbi:hypothetical protein C1H46_008034 [Malus baccata]|uniref:Uncharacterized protein n=1 Tax=Malus baccata TaxID=106549 RepID=A0A540N5K7_MALBA|nr:hypothetical protein C1H46_008034 [Malus baccata]
MKMVVKNIEKMPNKILHESAREEKLAPMSKKRLMHSSSRLSTKSRPPKIPSCLAKQATRVHTINWSNISLC